MLTCMVGGIEDSRILVCDSEPVTEELHSSEVSLLRCHVEAVITAHIGSEWVSVVVKKCIYHIRTAHYSGDVKGCL